MSPRTGRPKSDNPKRNDVKVRFDDETLARLDDYCERTCSTRSDAIRKGVNAILEKKEEQSLD